MESLELLYGFGFSYFDIFDNFDFLNNEYRLLIP
jgi:hypothetical protein